MIEAAWIWLRWQPQSKLSRWYRERYGDGASRAKRVGITALARKLLVAFWRLVTHGVVPDGAVLTVAKRRQRRTRVTNRASFQSTPAAPPRAHPQLRGPAPTSSWTVRVVTPTRATAKMSP